ncbi:helix-turn-helix domain-containing protein [Polaribacter litorisediminis]|uniref:helix-turn-helix domain-containing protein n=1 Tax=Polaribacter litorisediminis TaxID=1908341 RepID=UPI001CC063E7|nr:helix-turn-helix transcriptional regulator [Polaribacter litorisediminis]UAM97888.1 helix-turn-helix domain-containing protein [Polaribacter litorisediminis]
MLKICTTFVFLKKKDFFTYFVKDEYEAILKNLISIRKEKGITQYQVGKRLGLSDNAYSKLENGHIKLDAQWFLFILKIFDINLKDFKGFKKN